MFAWNSKTAMTQANLGLKVVWLQPKKCKKKSYGQLLIDFELIVYKSKNQLYMYSCTP